MICLLSSIIVSNDSLGASPVCSMIFMAANESILAIVSVTFV